MSITVILMILHKRNTPYLVFFYLGNIFSSYVNSYSGGDVFDRIFHVILELNEMRFLTSFDIINISIEMIFVVVIKLLNLLKKEKS